MLTIAKLTIGEAARRRVLWVLVILALVAVGLTAWGVAQPGRRPPATKGSASSRSSSSSRRSSIFLAFMFGFVLVMTAAFFGSPAIATDLETGVAQAMLARPLAGRRTSWAAGSGWPS